MTDRVLELAEQGAHLRVRVGALEVVRASASPIRIPLVDVGVLVLSHSDVVLTLPVLSALAGAGASVVICDGKHMPVAQLLPLAAHFAQGERFRMQAAAPAPRTKRAWQAIVQAKVRAQAALLQRLGIQHHGLDLLARQVKSGDTGNVEAQAARRYWPLLFGDPSFRRHREAGDQNRYLNYGYAVLRAMTARAICASGLHPGLGLHHHNRYDPFALASDLMEPFRAIVDETVVRLVDRYGGAAELTQELRAELLVVCHTRVQLDGEARRLPDALTRAAQSLVGVLEGTGKHLAFPQP